MDRVVHFEIPADNLERAKSFYSNVFGWDVSDFDKNYFLASTVPTDEDGMPTEIGTINGGLRRREENATTPTIVISVENIDKTVEKVVANGGRLVLPKAKIDHILIYSKVMDSEGNIVALAQAIEDE